MSLLDSMAVTLGKGLDVVLTNMVLTQKTPGTYDPETGMSSADAVNAYPCRGIVTAYTNLDRLNTRIGENDRRVLIAAITLPVKPAVGDLIAVTNTIGDPTYRVLHVDIDPANAFWDLQAVH